MGMSRSTPASTSKRLFLTKPKNFFVSTTLELIMTASSPKSSLTSFIASVMDGAVYFFIFNLRSPPRHFEFQHLHLIRYRTKSEFAGNNVPLIVVSASELLVNIK